MPRPIAKDNDMPRRRRGSSAIAADAETERGLVMSVLLRSPKDMVAGVLAFAAVSAIIANAVFLQAGHHPSPMFGSTVVIPPEVAPASPLPRPRPVEALRPAEPVPAEAKPAEPKAGDPLTNLVKAVSAQPVAPSAPGLSPPVAPANIPRPPAPIPLVSRNEAVANPAQASRRVAAVQRTLTEYGYGQLKPTGTVGSDTQAAIAKFERDRKIPVTGQISDRLVRELSAMIGRPID